MRTMLKVVFMGTPDFAVPTLRALLAHYHVAAVITQPDRPAGRGRKLHPSAVRQAAEASGIAVQTPPRLRKPQAFEALAALAPDLIVVAAFGQILRQNVLDLPRYGCINVHGSLLPRHRGAAPVAAAILAGDEQVGVTILKMDAGIDTGPTLGKHAIFIRPGHTTATLTIDLAGLGAALLIDTLPGYLSGELQPQPQDDALATYAPMLTKADGKLDFTQPAGDLARQVRAMAPWPGTFAMLGAQRLKVLQASAQPGTAMPGLVVKHNKAVAVGTGAGLLQLDIIQPPGKKAMAASAYANGRPEFVGAVLT